MANNPVVTLGFSVPTPGDPTVIRKTFARIVYNAQKFFLYGDGEFGAFDPTEQGEEFFIFVPFSDSNPHPSFVSDGAWDGLQKSSSGFVTAVNSIMPKIMVPSTKIIDNGLLSDAHTFEGQWNDSGTFTDNFSWELVSFNGTPIGSGTTDLYDYAQVGPNYGSQYVSTKAKDDSHSTDNTLIMKLDEPATPPSFPDTEGTFVCAGAFILMLNVVPTRATSADPGQASKRPWTVTMEFGEVKMIITDSGSTEIILGQAGGTSEPNKTTVNLAEGKAKNGPPQQQHITEKDPFVILVYPVWNGLVVASGIQDAYATVFSSSYYVPRFKGASIMNQPYSSGFDPQNPAPVEVDATDAMVDMGDSLTLTVDNCRVDVAYLPCYFAQKCWFDEWRLYPDDVGGTVSYTFYVWPIWTDNNTATILNPSPDVTDSGYSGSITGTHYGVTEWRLKQNKFNRVGGEIFGSILETNETWDFPIKNGNGSFNITTGSWADYIQSVTVSTNIDGSSGTIIVDKYGAAGQHAATVQSVGAITISASGGYGTQGGNLFQGLAMGIADNRSSDGATWSIPLVGLEKKLDDIMLINVPFFDGETFGVVSDFLSRYAGIIGNTSHANTSVRLGSTDDIAAVRFDWKAGTTVRSALDDVMADTLHSYVVMDGAINFYQLNPTTGLPISFGTDWSGQYPNSRTVMYDATPDFEDLRNEIVVLALQQIADGQGTNIENLPAFPRIQAQSNTTTPDIPWAKTLVRPLPGMLDPTQIDTAVQRLSASCSRYELLGRTTIPGNALIRPYDMWGQYVIYGVTQNIDLRSKTWTTDLEFMKNTR